MPGRNGTGPLGLGPRSGRGMGKCNPSRGTGDNNTVNPNVLSGTITTGWFERMSRFASGRWFGRRRRNR